jgi:tryptophanyl-tRNA synthetase
VQSEVPAIVDLTWRLSMLLPFNRVMRNPTLKDELELNRRLRARGIVVCRRDLTTPIPFSEIRDKLEPVWEAIRAAEQIRR